MKSNLFSLGLITILMLMESGCSLDPPNNNVVVIDPGGEGTFREIDTLPNGNLLVNTEWGTMYEGDITIDFRQWENLRDFGNIFGDGVTGPYADRTLNPVTNLPNEGEEPRLDDHRPYALWAMVRFVYDDKLTDLQKERIKAALMRIQSNTNVRFYNATELSNFDQTYGTMPYIRFIGIGEEYTGFSSVGMMGGEQLIGLPDDSFLAENIYRIEHEICHALGMLHEQCRSDRDSYVVINTDNLTERGRAWFVKEASQYFRQGDYDYQSVMGYSSWLASPLLAVDPSKPVYAKRDGQPIYQGEKLSDLDRKWLNYFYLPYVARSDTYLELDTKVYDGNNLLSESERLKLQASLNNGNSTPPAGGRIPNEF